MSRLCDCSALSKKFLAQEVKVGSILYAEQPRNCSREVKVRSLCGRVNAPSVSKTVSKICMVCIAGTKRLLARDCERSGLSGLYGMHSRDQKIARER